MCFELFMGETCLFPPLTLLRDAFRRISIPGLRLFCQKLIFPQSSGDLRGGSDA